MTFIDSVLTALFCMAVVFAVLAMLWGIIRIFSYVIREIEKRSMKETN
jgi:Na+-transporting methylmalonyl-CoA/oxaloacetate decarboxylase gamma subunit